MHIISTAKATVLSQFPTLKTKFIYPHSNNEANDFQFFSQQQHLFLEVNKKAGLEFLRIKNVAEDKMEINAVRKMKVENVYCAACQKQGNEIALGTADGKIKLLHYKTLEVNHTFPADSSRNSVVFLDYNASDEYISSVYENGLINIYGIKTKTKLETLNSDNNTNLGRFHPLKRFNLSVASEKGSVFVYDIHTKRKVFTATDCHSAPCRDLCMSPALPDVLISVGFDCLINIFDTRKKTKPNQIRYCHPLSTGSLSECGNYFCVGNLKGELISYDLRNTKSFITSKKVHDGAVVRIAFMPNKEDTNSSSASSGNQTQAEANIDVRKSLANLDNVTCGRRDSFCDFLDFHSNKGFDKSRFSTRRDSFDWDALNRKPNVEDNRSSIAPRFSLSADIPVIAVSSFEEKENVSDKTEIIQIRSGKHDDGNALKDRSNIDGKRLKNIKEESEVENKDDKYNIDEGNISTKDIEQGFNTLPNDKNSTPNNCKRTAPETLRISTGDLIGNNILKEIASLRVEMNNRFAQLESDIKLNAECNKWHIFTQNSNLWNKQIENSEEIQDALNLLLQTDPFVNEFVRLKEENALLKREILKNKPNM